MCGPCPRAPRARGDAPARPHLTGVRSVDARSKVVRKSIARVLTVINQQKKEHLRDFYKDKDYIPLDLRAKKTRAIRRALTPAQKAMVTVKEAKRKQNFPQRKFAIKA